MDALDVIYHSRNNQLVRLKDIPERFRVGILPAKFLHDRALELIEKDKSLLFFQTEDFSKHFLFYNAFRYSLVDDNNAYLMFTCNEDRSRWWFDTNVNTRITSGLSIAA